MKRERAPSAQPGGCDLSLKNVIALSGLTVLALLVMGYHPGLEDDSFYLAAIKRNLNPALFPHDSEFFSVQFQATIFDKLIALSAQLTHLPVEWAVMLWQIAAIFLVILGCWRISRRCFALPQAQWAATVLITVLLTLPLPGIAIAISDQYLHPRTLATAAILAAIVAVMDRKPWTASVLLLFALSVHAIMACFGISFCAFLWWTLHATGKWRGAELAAMLFPLGWIFEPASDAWRQAAATRGFYFLSRWHWYEWLGVFAPLLILFFIRRLQSQGKSLQQRALLPLISAVLAFGVFQTVAGLIIMLPPSLERLRPFEPMRYLQLLYLVFFLIVGGLLGEFVLKRHTYRWALLFIPLAAGMFYAQREMYPASAHLEFPWTARRNPWLQSFAWIRANTPPDALFAFDPHYETLPAEDFHGFRSLADRSSLADYEKDGGMAARVPSLAPRWLKEVTARNGWSKFQPSDLARLKNEFGIDWIVVSKSDALYSADDRALTCPFTNEETKVCRLY